MKNLFGFTAMLLLIAVGLACNAGSGTTGTKIEDKPAAKDSPKTEDPKKSNEAVAMDPTGTYKVKGSSPGGKSYDGELVIAKRGEVFQLSWTVGSESYDGVGVMVGNTLAGAYSTGTDGTGCGVVIYDVNGDDLTGKWGAWGVNSVGSETAKPQGDLKGNIGTFNVSGTNPNGSAYSGTMTITKFDGSDVMNVQWNTGTKFSGSAIKFNDRLIAGSGAKQCGFVAYSVTASGLEGRWGVPGSKDLGDESGTKK